MKTTVDIYSFRREFEQCRPNNFSYEGLAVLFNYLEELEANTGQELELDVIAMCCDYNEDTVSDIARNYSIDLNDLNPEDDDYQDQCIDVVREYLMDQGAYCGETATGFVYSAF
jgi:hypothetical protein